jgi:hypothetical protein
VASLLSESIKLGVITLFTTQVGFPFRSVGREVSQNSAIIGHMAGRSLTYLFPMVPVPLSISHLRLALPLIV